MEEEVKEEMTVEKVKEVANSQIQMLYKKLEEANMANAFRRLDYLFAINAGNFSDEMKAKAQAEINSMVFGPAEEKGTKEN